MATRRRRGRFNFDAIREKTNQELAAELARVSPLTEDEISSLLPRRVDKQRLGELIQIVNSAASQNNKVASLTSNIAELGGVAVKLLSKYLKPV